MLQHTYGKTNTALHFWSFFLNGLIFWPVQLSPRESGSSFIVLFCSCVWLLLDNFEVLLKTPFKEKQRNPENTTFHRQKNKGVNCWWRSVRQLFHQYIQFIKCVLFPLLHHYIIQRHNFLKRPFFSPFKQKKNTDSVFAELRFVIPSFFNSNEFSRRLHCNFTPEPTCRSKFYSFAHFYLITFCFFAISDNKISWNNSSDFFKNFLNSHLFFIAIQFCSFSRVILADL